MKTLRKHHRHLPVRALLVWALGILVVQFPGANAQELKKVRMGYPAFSLTFLTFFVAKDAGIFKKRP